ncbi:hypothetical protein L7F22_021935 [Adiantum nelumboides]|nr:hypothetical protein [Adiantum nelumboides]
MLRSRGFLLLFLSWLLLCISLCALSEQGDPDAQEVDDDSASDPGDALIADSAQEYSDVELVPARGVHTVYFFPKDADKSIPAGEEAEVIVGISNHGDLPLNVHSIWASLHLAYDQRYQIQNFTAVEFGKSIVPPSVQASFPYTFTVSKFLQPGSFALVASIFYEVDGTPYRSVFYNGTIEVIEPSGFLSGETLFLVTLGLEMLGLLGMWLYGQFQKLSKKTRRTKKVETGTRSMDAVNNEWLQARQARIENVKELQAGKQRIAAKQKFQEVDLTSQSTQEPKEKDVVDITNHVEHLKKIQRERNLEEQRAAALAREKIKEGLKRIVEQVVLEPREGEPKKQQQEEDEENIENIQADPTAPSSKSPPPASFPTPRPPSPLASPTAPSSPQHKAPSVENISTQPSSQGLDVAEVPRKDSRN